MRARSWSPAIPLTVALLAPAAFIGCGSPASGPEQVSAPASQGQSSSSQVFEKGGQEEFGPYEPVENWPQPLPDGPDGVTHEGWTWGSVGAVYAETPDRIWIAQRGELPLPPGATPWTPYGLLSPPEGPAAMTMGSAPRANRDPSAGGNGAITMSSSW